MFGIAYDPYIIEAYVPIHLRTRAPCLWHFLRSHPLFNIMMTLYENIGFELH